MERSRVADLKKGGPNKKAEPLVFWDFRVDGGPKQKQSLFVCWGLLCGLSQKGRAETGHKLGCLWARRGHAAGR
jgi:hypothetical protein